MDPQVPVNGSKRVRPGRRLSLRQVIDIQRIAHEAALGLHADFLGTNDREERARVAAAISNLGKAWCSLQDAKREILGRPKAGVFKPERPKRKRKPYWEVTSIFKESLDDPQPTENKPTDSEVKWEMQDVPGHPGMQVQVVLDSPAIRAAATAGSSPAPEVQQALPLPQRAPVGQVLKSPASRAARPAPAAKNSPLIQHTPPTPRMTLKNGKWGYYAP